MAFPSVVGQMSYGTTTEAMPAPSAGDTARAWTIDPNLPTATITGQPVAPDDWIIMICTTQSSEPTSRTPTAPLDWTILCPFATTGSGTMCFGAWARRRQAGDTTYTWTVNNDLGRTGGTNYRMLFIRGAQDISQWSIGSFVDRHTNATTTTAIAPSVLVSKPDTLGLCMAAERTITAETDAQVTMGNFTKSWFNLVNDVTFVTGTKTFAVPGVTSTVTVSYPNPHAYNAIAGILAIPGAAITPGLSIKRSDGAVLQDARLQVSDGMGGLINPGGMRVVKPGYLTVTSMLASTPSKSILSFDAIAESATVTVSAPWGTSGVMPTGSMTAAAHGARGARWASTGAYGRIAYDFGSNQPGPVVLSWYMKIRAFSGSNLYLASVSDVPTGGVTQGDVRVNAATKTLSIRDGVTAVATSVATVSLDTLYRCEWRLDATSNMQTLRVYAGESTVPFITLTGAWSSDLTRLLAFGPYIAAAGGAIDYDTVRVANDWRGPFATEGPFFVAHRGGSRDFPEMSLYAYGQSALRGYGALEISLGRTSDGVWIGLHDQDINRTSGTTGLPAVSSMTWAQVQNYQILGSVAPNNPSQPSRPYMRLDELIEMYYQSHVLVMDIKYAAAYQTEFISKISALPGTPQERIIGKAFGVGSTFPSAMTTAGFRSWGYFYEDQYVSGELATYQGRWSILGMAYDASAASWAAVTSYGKPVMGHICPTLSAANTALSYGCQGLMCSGAIPIVPTSPYSNN